MKDIMIDIETLGVRPYSSIVQLAAVAFNPNTGETGAAISFDISTESNYRLGLKRDEGTTAFWKNQGTEAYNRIMLGETPLTYALNDLMNFSCDGDSSFRIWANSPSFDLALIRQACERAYIDVVWKYWQEMDVRTIANLNPNVKKSMPFVGNKHDATNDCMHQIKVLSNTLTLLNITL